MASGVVLGNASRRLFFLVVKSAVLSAVEIAMADDVSESSSREQLPERFTFALVLEVSLTSVGFVAGLYACCFPGLLGCKSLAGSLFGFGLVVGELMYGPPQLDYLLLVWAPMLLWLVPFFVRFRHLRSRELRVLSIVLALSCVPTLYLFSPPYRSPVPVQRYVFFATACVLCFWLLRIGLRHASRSPSAIRRLRLLSLLLAFVSLPTLLWFTLGVAQGALSSTYPYSGHRLGVLLDYLLLAAACFLFFRSLRTALGKTILLRKPKFGGPIRTALRNQRSTDV